MITRTLVNAVFITVMSTAVLSPCYAENNSWQRSTVVQGYFQPYDGSTTRDLAFNAGVYLKADYLDSAGVGFGYNYTFVGFEHNADLTEHLFYLSGRYHQYLDILPGKLTYRLDGYFGEDTLQYNINNPPAMMPGGMGGKKTGNSNTVTESTDVSVYQPQLAFINFAKTFYVDIGYAYSEYDGDVTTKVDQFTPTVGFGWNESYDWLQMRGYFINVNQSSASLSDKSYESLEIKYTHWFIENSESLIENWQLTGLVGDRLLAVDPDAAVVYSTADVQTASLSASIQWKLSESSKLMALLNASQHENESSGNDYDSLLFYINLQRKW